MLAHQGAFVQINGYQIVGFPLVNSTIFTNFRKPNNPDHCVLEILSRLATNYPIPVALFSRFVSKIQIVLLFLF